MLKYSSKNFFFGLHLKSTSINCRKRLEYKADGAQKPECTREYMRISSTDRRCNHGAQQIEVPLVILMTKDRDGRGMVRALAFRECLLLIDHIEARILSQHFRYDNGAFSSLIVLEQ